MALSPYYGIFDPFAGVDPFAGPDPFFALGFPTQTGGGMTGRSRVVDYPMVSFCLKSLNRRQFSIDLPARLKAESPLPSSTDRLPRRTFARLRIAFKCSLTPPA